MDEKQTKYFQALTMNRVEAAKALEGFALRGVKNSVVEKYSDQASSFHQLLRK